MPCKLGRGGLVEVVELTLSDEEQAMLDGSAEHVRSTMGALS